MKTVPDNHPISKMLRALTERAFTQARLSDGELVVYVSDMLLHFMHTDNLYPYEDESGSKIRYVTDMIQTAEQAGWKQKQQIYRYVGDYVLFILGVFPESLERPRRTSSPSLYAYHGRRSYVAASELQRHSNATHLYRKMADHFERCVLGLNWFKEYTRDPFYQYMLREFNAAG